jgi:hypothetical protein
MISRARDINVRFQTRPPVERKIYATGVSWPHAKLWFLLLLRIPVPCANAQPIAFHIPCLDTMAINAEYVFVGKIVAIHELVRSGANTNVDVSVEKWLKGDGQSDTTQARIDVPVTVLTDWKIRASRLLIFNGVGGGKLAGVEDLERAMDLSDPDLRVLTADMEVLRDPEQILQAAQGAIQRHPGVYRISTFTRNVPTETARMFGQTLWPVTTVPADADLERWALSALDSEQAGERAEAADALWRFPSEANAARLKLLLDDPALSDKNIYFVRKRAYESLLDMGVRVPEPVLEKQPARP